MTYILVTIAVILWCLAWGWLFAWAEQNAWRFV